MWRRRETERERTLLAIIREQQTIIRELCDRLADANGKPWTLPPRPVEKIEPSEEQERLAELATLLD